jgi:hypothetical protein
MRNVRLPAEIAVKGMRWRLVGAVLLLLVLLAITLTFLVRRPSQFLLPVPRITVLSKVVGLADELPGSVPATSDGSFGVFGADLGAVTRYGDRWYMALGDTSYAPLKTGLQGNFLVASSHYQAGALQTLPLDGFLAQKPVGGMQMPFRAIRPDPGYSIPGGMFTVAWHGHQYMIGEYLEGGDFVGNDHWARDSRLALYNPKTHVFQPYKPQVYVWRRTDRRTTDANRLQYSFAQDGFWEDASHTYLYMVGSPANRFGGVKLARIVVASFVNVHDDRGWSYYLGHGHWSAPARDEMRIDAAVSWLIPPADPSFSLDKDYDTFHYPRGASACSYLRIAEFSLIWNPYLRRFLLLTTGDGCQAGYLDVYSAPALTGPWTSSAQRLPLPPAAAASSPWDYYAPYTTSSLLRHGGRQMYFLASDYPEYGIYLFRADFPAPASRRGG